MRYWKPKRYSESEGQLYNTRTETRPDEDGQLPLTHVTMATILVGSLERISPVSHRMGEDSVSKNELLIMAIVLGFPRLCWSWLWFWREKSRDDWKLRSGRKGKGLKGKQPKCSLSLTFFLFLSSTFSHSLPLKRLEIRRTEIQFYSRPTGIWLQNVLIMDVRLGDLIKFARNE